MNKARPVAAADEILSYFSAYFTNISVQTVKLVIWVRVLAHSRPSTI